MTGGEGWRRWRALDAGTIRVFIEAAAPRVACRDHGVVVAAVPWARHGAGHTRAFDDQVAWLVTHTSKTAVVELMRVAWRTVGAIASRVVADAREVSDPFDGLTRIGIDEISYRRGHKYLMVVVDHDTGRLVWAKAGHDRATLQAFFDLLGPQRASRIKLISADAAEWIADCALAACPNATLCLDPFHICRWASQALDVVRRWIWNLLRSMGLSDRAAQLKGCRYALWKNPEDPTGRQAAKLAWIARHNHQLYRAYLLKEQLRLVFQHRGKQAVAILDAWLGWARRCQIPTLSATSSLARPEYQCSKISTTSITANDLLATRRSPCLDDRASVNRTRDQAGDTPRPRPTGELLDRRGGELNERTTPPLGNSVNAHTFEARAGNSEGASLLHTYCPPQTDGRAYFEGRGCFRVYADDTERDPSAAYYLETFQIGVRASHAGLVRVKGRNAQDMGENVEWDPADDRPVGDPVDVSFSVGPVSGTFRAFPGLVHPFAGQHVYHSSWIAQDGHGDAPPVSRHSGGVNKWKVPGGGFITETGNWTVWYHPKDEMATGQT